MLFEYLPLVMLGFGLGMVHALDADHVMAVTAMSNQKPKLWPSVQFSAKWALGHGGILLASGVLLYGLGVAIPEPLQRIAELSVGVLLIVLGLGLMWQIRKERLSLQLHSHGELKHSHWHKDDHAKNGSHVPVMVGSLHGLAGSAPALALIPVAGQGHMSVVLSYLLLFSVGVMLAMMLFGFGLGWIQRTLKHYREDFLLLSRKFVASASSVVGVVWLYQAL